MPSDAELKAGRRVVATIEARMTSSRLPGKVLMEACGKPMLELMVERVRRMRFVDAIVVATTTNATDDPIATLCARLGVGCFRGSEDDVLGRLDAAVREAGADVVVELTGDCPLLDPSLADQVVEFFLINGPDLASNDHFPFPDTLDYDSYPVGMDVMVFSAGLLAQAASLALAPDQREHPTRWMLQNGDLRIAVLPAPTDLHRPDLSLTLDTHPEYERIRAVFEALYPRDPSFGLREMLAFIDAHPGLAGVGT
jgi:spore coat polysaccharide biosynthesis protein SpsF